MRIGLISPQSGMLPTSYDDRDVAEIAEYIQKMMLSGSSEAPLSTASATSTSAKDWFPASIPFMASASAVLPLLAGLTPDGPEITIIDENREDVDFDEDFDLVGLTAMTRQATRAYQIADEFRSRGVHVAIGGIHATVLPEEAKEHADTVVVGEGENTWPQFIGEFQKGEARPFYRDPGVVDMTRSPVPRFDLLKEKGYKAVVVQAARGCPHDCEFCASSKVYGARYRHKTVAQVVREIEGLLIRDSVVEIQEERKNKRDFAHPGAGLVRHYR